MHSRRSLNLTDEITPEIQEAIDKFTIILCQEICEDLVQQSTIFLSPEELQYIDLDQFQIHASLGGTQMIKNLLEKHLIDVDELMKYVKQ